MRGLVIYFQKIIDTFSSVLESMMWKYLICDFGNLWFMQKIYYNFAELW